MALDLPFAVATGDDDGYLGKRHLPREPAVDPELVREDLIACAVAVGVHVLLAIVAALMIGTAGLPHVIVRFFTVPKVTDARKSAGYALIFICVMYTTIPAVAAFSRLNLAENVNDTVYAEAPQWISNWENTGLIAWLDKNDDGVMQYHAGKPFAGKPDFAEGRGAHGQRLLNNSPTDSPNEVYVDRDIMVMANPEIAEMPAWVIALMAAGAVAAALSTAAGLLLVISSSI